MIAIYIILGLMGVLALKLFLISIIFRQEIEACFERDPAAISRPEVLLTYPGLQAIIFHRVAHFLFKKRAPLLPRLISQLARHITGIEIHPGAKIGKGLFIDHGMGVIIGETSSLGDNVTLFQGVTLGGTGKERGKRHPTLGNNVVIGAGAKILGNITIGDDVQVGANAVVIRSVPPRSTVVGIPGRIARRKGEKVPGVSLDHTNLPDPLAERLEKLQHHIDEVEKELMEWRKSKNRSQKTEDRKQKKI
ncbi:serine O-acetyltransferase [candidate division NPL-UPA2 bacterium]|nr:serine O-acetyltransferase [candidate division NPL-UPA2 bacterium]